MKSYAPFFCDYVLQTILTDEAFGETPEEREAFLRRGGYTIRTTLDPKVHRSATDTVNEFIPPDDDSRKGAYGPEDAPEVKSNLPQELAEDLGARARLA